jgi:ABC-2 type transport system permease protein
MDNKLMAVAKREYMERVRSRWFILGTLAVPALAVAALAIPMYMASRGASSSLRHITVIDATGTGMGDRVAKALMADSSLGSGKTDSVVTRVVNVNAAQLPAQERATTAEVEQPKHIVGYLVLTDSTLAGKSARYAGRNASSIADMEKLESVVRQASMIVRLEHQGVRSDIVNDLASSHLKVNSERLSERGRSGSGEAGLIAGIAVGLLLFMSIIIHGNNVLRGVLEEKSTRVAEVVLSSVKPETLLAGKVLGVGAVGLTQQIAWLGIGAYLMGFVAPLMMKNAGGGVGAGGASGTMSGMFASLSPEVLAVALLYFVIGFVFYATLYAAAGSMVNSEQEAQQAAVPVMILLMSTWLMVNPVMINPNSTLAVVLSWLPWSSPIIMPMRMGLTPVSPMAIAGSVIVAILGCIVAIWLSARIYRVGMLMYGKKPSLAEVAKWIRYA